MKNLLLLSSLVLFSHSALASLKCVRSFEGERIGSVRSSTSVYLPPLTEQWRKIEGTSFEAYRANSPFLWNKIKSLKLNSSAAEVKGLDLGDAHDFNFDFTELQGGKVELMLNDFDDVGNQVSFLAGAAKRAAGNLLTDYQATPTELWKAYTEGLQNTQRPVPSYIQKGLKLTSADFLKGKLEYFKEILNPEATKFSNEAELTLRNNQNRFQNPEIQSLHEQLEPQLTSYLQKRFGTETQILDIGFKVKKTGGSMGQARFWYLINSKGQIEVMEFKHHPGSSLKFYNLALNFVASLFGVKKTIPVDQLKFPLDYIPTSVGNFWARVRRPDPIVMENPEVMSKSTEGRMIGQKEISLYLMWVYGQWQSRQPEASQYLSKLSENPAQAFADFQTVALTTRDLVLSQHEPQPEALKKPEPMMAPAATADFYKPKSDESIGMASFNSALYSLERFYKENSNASISELVQKSSQSDLRKQFFYLQSLAKVYEDVDSSTFKKLRTNFKSVEDAIGQLVLKRDLRKNAEKMHSEDLAARFRKQEAEAMKKLTQVLEDNGWLKNGRKTIEDIRKKLASVNQFRNIEKDKEFLIEKITDATKELNENVKEMDFDDKDIEKGLHELRRRIRWILIQVQNLKGFAVFSDEQNLNPKTQDLLNTLLQQSPGLLEAKDLLFPKPLIAKPIQIPKKTYGIMTYYVKYIGDLKDQAEMYIYFSEQLKDPTLSPQKRAEIQKMLDQNFNPDAIDHRKISVQVQEAINASKLLKEFADQIKDMN